MSVATPSTVPITDYSDFWLHYLREHSKPETRALHYFGTSAGIVLWLTALWTHTFTLVPIGLFIGKAAQVTDAFLFLVQRNNYASSHMQATFVLGSATSLLSTTDLLHSSTQAGPSCQTL